VTVVKASVQHAGNPTTNVVAISHDARLTPAELICTAELLRLSRASNTKRMNSI
jgi:hypothetical protein